MRDASTDVADFDAFYRANVSAVTAVALALTGSPSLAEEIAQESFLAALRSWHKIRTYDDASAWVRRVATNIAISGTRRRIAEVRALIRVGLPRSPAPTLELPDAELWAAVRRLPPRQAQVVALRYVEDLPAADIASVLGCAEATVRVHLHRAHAALARQLGRDEIQEGVGDE